MEYLIGVDIGTTHTKAVVCSTTGEVLFEEKANYPTLQPAPGYSEQDPRQIFDAVISVLRDVLVKIPDKKNILGVCFSAAMHSLMAVDNEGLPLTHLYTWADTRAVDQARSLKGTPRGEEIYRATGTAIHPMSPLCKIAWMKAEIPEIFNNTYKFISVKEYVFFRLFNRYIVDYSVASATGLFNNKDFNWNKDSLTFAGISADKLSQPVSTAHVEKLADPALLQQLALEPGLPFIIGASDGCLAILGSGALAPNEAALTIGTSGAIRKINPEPLNDQQSRLFAYVLDDTMFVCGGATNNGGNVLKWFSENMLDRPLDSDEAFKYIMDSAAAVSPGAEGLIFLPYIHGERSPVWDADARGVFMGVTNLHTSKHFMRAMLEGICFSLQQIMQAMEESGTEIELVYASGGFIESDFWVQLLADVLNKRVIISRAADASAMGAIFLGLHALGFIKDWSEVKRLVVTSETFSPIEDNHKLYARNATLFASLYTKLAPDFAVLAKQN